MSNKLKLPMNVQIQVENLKPWKSLRCPKPGEQWKVSRNLCYGIANLVTVL